MRCPECGKAFRARRHDQAYCSAACNKTAGNRELARARALYRALYWWRYLPRTHASVADNLRFICREIRAWIDEDKALGRPPPPPHRHDVDRGHQRRPVPLMSPRLGGEADAT